MPIEIINKNKIHNIKLMDNKSLNAIWHSMQINDFNTTKTNLMIDISVYICIKDYVLLYTENFVLHKVAI